MRQGRWVGFALAAAAGCGGSSSANDAGMSPDVLSAPDVVDASKRPDIVDVATPPDVIDATTATDAQDVTTMADVADVPSTPDVPDVPTTADVTDAVPACATTGETRCGGVCVNTLTNAANCGSCGTACGAGLVCRQGGCVCTTDGQTFCPAGDGGVCVNFQSDNANCGACRNVCPAGQTCGAAQCRCNDTALTACGAACVNRNTDPANCGGCGVVCSAGRVCRAGSCTPCSLDQSVCNNACVDLGGDPNHCGMCGRVCPGGTVCVAGECGAARLDAMYPSLIDRGDNNRVCFHGAFGTNPAVTFPGVTTPVPATRVGGSQVCVDVPPEATAGPVTVRSANGTTGALTFRRTSFLTGLQPFRSRYEQTGYARQTPSLLDARAYAGSFEAGLHLYVVGGRGAGGALRSVERAMVNADGTLGAFERSDRQLVTPREGPAVVRLGGFVYVVGGRGGGAPVTSIERASVGSDGALGAFETQPITLREGRSGHAVAVVGGYVYVFGGRGATDPIQSIERAPIQPNGELGDFVAYTAQRLPSARADAAVAVLGQSVCLFGGAGAPRAVDCAPITGTGALDAFTTRGTLAVAREGATAMQLGGRVYVFGGRGTAPDSVDAADFSVSGTFSGFATTRSLIAARRGAVLARVGNYVFLVGGEGTDLLASVERAQFIANGTALESCTVTGSLDAVRSEGSHVVVGNRIYLLGGSAGPSVSSALIGVTGQIGTFEVVPGYNLRYERMGGGASVVGQQVCVTGGRPTGSTGWGSDTFCGTVRGDGSIGAFTADGTAIPSEYNGGQLAWMTPAVLDDDLWLIGGNARGILHGYGARRRAGMNWTLVGGSIAEGRSDARGVVLQDGLYIVGGQDVNMARNTVLRGAIVGGVPGTITIASGLTLPRAQQSASAVVVGDRFLTIGGVATHGGLREIHASTINADHTLSAFTTLSSPAACIDTTSAPGAVVIGDWVYILGGASSASVQRFALR